MHFIAITRKSAHGHLLTFKMPLLHNQIVKEQSATGTLADANYRLPDRQRPNSSKRTPKALYQEEFGL